MPWLLALMFTTVSLSAATPYPYESASRGATSNEVSQIQDYTRSLGKDWVKETFDIDLDAFGLRLGRRLQSAVGLSERGVPELNREAAMLPGDRQAGQVALYQLDLRIDQVGDLRRLSFDKRDIPFALKFHADGSLLANWLKLRTDVLIPFSWKDELRATALIPLPHIGGNPLDSLDQALGLRSRWDLTGAYTNRLGISGFETGLGTQWLKIWNLSVVYQQRFGQGLNENSQWLKIGRSF